MKQAHWLMKAAVLAGALTGFGESVMGAPRDDPRPVEWKAAEAQRAGRFEAARKYVQHFIDICTGDPRMPAMKKGMHDIMESLAKEWLAEGRTADGARVCVELTKDPLTPEEEKPAILRQAAQAMTGALTDARQKREYTRALELHKDWLEMFPSKPDVYTEDEVEKFSLEAMSLACADKFNLMALEDVTAQFYPSGGRPEDGLAKKNHNEPVAVSSFRALAEEGWGGRLLAEYEGMGKGDPLRSNAVLISQVEKAAAARAEAWSQQGNVAATLAALAMARELGVSETTNAGLKQAELKFGARLAGQPQGLATSGSVQKRMVWQDTGTGFTAKDVVIDNDVDVSANAGFLLDGGRIEVLKAQLHLHGTAVKPVVFRNVTVILDPGATFDAEFSVFINCTFGRAGELKDAGATRWTLNGCMIYRSKFLGLDDLGYKVHFANSAWVESVLPERVLYGTDLAAAYTNSAIDVSNCLFFRTKLAPSTVWMGRQCNYVRCTLEQDSVYDSKTTLGVSLFVPEEDPMERGLQLHTVPSDKGDVRYSFVRRAFDVGVPATFWSLLPVEGPEVKADATQPAAKPAGKKPGAK